MKSKYITVCLAFLFVLTTGSFAQKKDKVKLLDYVGKYTFPENDLATEVEIDLKSDTLWASSTLGKIKLTHFSEEVFEVREYNVKVTFLRSTETNTINAVKVLIPNLELLLEGVKE